MYDADGRGCARALFILGLAILGIGFALGVLIFWIISKGV